jgi:hypothetical protein
MLSSLAAPLSLPDAPAGLLQYVEDVAAHYFSRVKAYGTRMTRNILILTDFLSVEIRVIRVICVQKI